MTSKAAIIANLMSENADLRKKIDDMDAELRNNKRHAAIGRAVERASEQLPFGFDLHIELEKDSGVVRLYWPDGEEEQTEFHDCDHFSGVIDNAIDFAISSA